MRSSLAVLGAVAALGLGVTVAAARKYDTTPPPDRDGMITVHLIPHTHDDVGWLKTVDEYLLGTNNTIQYAGVTYVLSTVVEQLEANPDRRFTYVEIGFFWRWWQAQDASMQARVKALVANGQLTFTLGGWCMSDEAAPSVWAMIDQTTLGHTFLKETFNVVPRIGWQIDPFGHSSTMQSLMTGEVGFDAMYVARIDYQDFDIRTNESTLEMVWRGSSQNLGAATQSFFGVFHAHYGPPSGLCFDTMCDDGQVVDEPYVNGYNVPYWTNLFINTTLTWLQANAKGQNQMMFLMGDDFQYRNAIEWYQNLDKLIYYVNQLSNTTNIRAMYSTPELYTTSVHAQNLSWTVKTDDFFPYSDCDHCVWSGYFTSRPSEKGFTRVGDGVLRAASFADGSVAGSDGSVLFPFRDAMGIAQHHDSVAGTAKQHVAYDYYQRIAGGIALGKSRIAQVLASKMGGGVNAAALQTCPTLNETVCAASVSGNSFDVVFYNWLPRTRSEWVRVPISDALGNVTVTDSSGHVVPSSIVSNLPAVPNVTPSSSQSVAFQVTAPGVGYTTYRIVGVPKSLVRVHEEAERPAASGNLRSSSATQVVTNGVVMLMYDPTLGRLQSVSNIASGVSSTISQDWYWYNASSGTDNGDGTGFGNWDGLNSGAYIFRPNATTPIPIVSPSTAIPLTVTRLQHVTEVRQTWGSLVSQVTRLYDGEDFVEVEATVGPIPIDDGNGKEIITRWVSDIASQGTWYTDSNLREFQQRWRNYRPTWPLNLTEPVAYNYFPVNGAIYLNDSSRLFAVLTDRSQGGSSMLDGSVELMAHRRLLFDDWRGVGEPLNETTSAVAPGYPLVRTGTPLVIRTVYRVYLGSPSTSMAAIRPRLDRVFASPVLFVSTPAGLASATAPTASLIKSNMSLPVNVHLANADARSDGTVLVRLAHQFAKGEDAVLSQNVSVDITSLFDRPIIQVDELTLTGNQYARAATRLVWTTNDHVIQPATTTPKPIDWVSPSGKPAVPGDVVIPLWPMKIRTFAVTFQS